MAPHAKASKIPWHLIVIFLLLGMGIGTSGYFYHKNQKEHIKKHVAEELSAIADLKFNEILNWRYERMADARAIAERGISPFTRQEFKTESSSRSKQEIFTWISSLKKGYAYRSIFLLDTEGNPLISIVNGEEPVGSYAKRLASETVKRKEIIFSDLYKGESNDIDLDLLVPLTVSEEGNRKAVGVILLRIDPHQFLYPLIQSWPTPSETGETLIVRREGDEVVFLNELRHQKDTSFSLRFPISEGQLPAAMAARGKEGIVEGLDYRKVPVLAAIHRIPDSPWFLIAKVDIEEIYAAIHEGAVRVTLLASLLIVGAGVLPGLFWYQQRARFYKAQYESELDHQALAQRFDYLTKYANDIFLLTDQNLKMVEGNDRALSAYGYTREEFLQLTLRELRPPDLRVALDDQIEQIEQSNGLVYESMHQRKDGTPFPVEVSSRLVEVEGKKFYQSIVRDITERKRAEEVLRESEQRVRLKLDSILSPEGSIGTLELADIIDAQAIQSLMDDFYKLAHIPMTITDLNGKMLVGVGWQEICTRFHRVHPQACKNCIESDTQLSAGISQGESRLYKCKNNMWDIATPIMVGGQHVGNLFSGQFFFDDEPLDYELFRSQARQYGFNEEEYIATLQSVPRLSRESVDTGMAFFMKLSSMVSLLSYSNVKLARSLTERDALMESLRAEEERFRVAAESLSDVVYEWDLGSSVQWFGDIDRLLGYAPGGFPRTLEGWVTILHPEDRERVWAAVERHLRGEAPYEIEYRLLHKDGAWRHWLARGTVLRDKSGKPFHWIGAITDTTEQKQVEEDLRRSREREHFLADIIEKADQPLGVGYPDGRLGVYNRAFCELTGYSVAELRELGWSTVLTPPEWIESEMKALAEIERTGRPVRYQKEYLRKDGRRVPIELLVHAVRDESGKTQYYYAFITDITDRKRTEEEVHRLNAELEQRVIERTKQLEVANKELEAFAYSVSHDLRAPLRAIDGFSQIVLEDYSDKFDAEGSRLLNVIRSNTHKMDQLITDLLALSRVSRTDMQLSRIDMTTLAHSIYHEITSPEVQQKFVFSILPLPDAYGDPALIRQVWNNLLSNAIKYTLPKVERRIEIDGHTEKGMKVYYVKDSGVGFNPDYTHKLFGVFQRLHRTEEFEGTGVGLAIVQRIIHRHGGRAWAEGKINEGATICFSLPEKEGGHEQLK